jgi:hypothetical protein
VKSPSKSRDLIETGVTTGQADGVGVFALVRLFALLWLFAALPAGAQELTSARPGEVPYLVPRIAGSIVLDGRADEPAWAAVEPLPTTMHLPTFGAPPTERTEFKIAYDSEYVYFSCQAYDSDVRGIRMYSFERDERTFRSDFCAIYLDTLNDEENALQFKTGPAGNRSDSHRSNDGGQSDSSWDAFWDAAVIRDGRGWFAEIRIPFSSVLFQAVDGRVVMGASMLRNISRKNERHVHPAISPDLGNFSYAQPSRMRKIIFMGVEEQRKPAYITPYALGGGGHTQALDEPGTGYDRVTDEVGEVGLDVRYGLTSNLTLQLTANTDFAQVEADDRQVNLTRFSLFFPEKRRFFQERASNFESSLGGQDRLFHSRTMGLVQGAPVRIYGGGRVVGRVGEWDVGVIDLQTAKAATLPSENLGVVRLRRRVLNPNSYVGGILTSRLGSGGRHNIVYGTDAIFRVVGDDYLVLNWAQSFDDSEQPTSGGAIDPLDRSIMRFNWERRGADGLTYALDVARAGEQFSPGMGFLRRDDFTKGQVNVGYGWRPAPGARFLTYALQADGAVFRRNADGKVESAEVGPTGVLETWGRHVLNFSVPFRYENLDAPFSLPEGNLVPAGTYRFAAARLQYRSAQGAPLQINTSVEGGQFFDGRRASVSFGPVWGPSAHLNLSVDYQVDLVDFPDRGQSFTTSLARFRTQVSVSTEITAAWFIQYSNTDREIVSNFRFRYNPREGNDLYVVWNEGLVTDRNYFEPARPLSDERTILIKYSHTLQFGV